MEKLENGKNPAHFLNRFLTYSCSDFVIYMPDSGLYQKIGQRIFPVTRNIQLSESLSNFDLNYLFALMTSLHSNGPSEKSTRKIKVKRQIRIVIHVCHTTQSIRVISLGHSLQSSTLAQHHKTMENVVMAEFLFLVGAAMIIGSQNRKIKETV